MTESAGDENDRIMNAIPIERIPKFHSVPLMRLRADLRRVTLSADSEKKQRVCLQFSPYQAIKVTTEDCFVFAKSGVIPFRLCVIQDSSWIPQLKKALKKVDHDATFLENAKHFILFATDGAVEVVATRMTFRMIKKRD